MMAVKDPVWQTQFQPRKRIYQAPGSGIKQLYQPKLLEDGTLDLIEAGTDDLYASIQSHKDSCDIHVLLQRYANGELDVLSRVQGVYGDFSEMPKTYAELLNAVLAGEQMFNSLPVEVREKFDHSLEKFMIAMDDMPSFLEKVGYKPEKSGAASASDAPAEPASTEGGNS